MIPIFISVVGALSAIIVSIFGARSTNRNNILLQTRKLKEDHYVNYIEALHDLMAENNSKSVLRSYTSARDKLFIVASEEVVVKLLLLEKYGMVPNVPIDVHDQYLTELIKSIRVDLKIIDKDFPQINFKKA